MIAVPGAIIFDWDDTLVDNYTAIHEAINTARMHFGLGVWSLEETREKCRRALQETFPEWFGVDWEQAKAIFYETFAATHLDRLTIKPGAGALLDGLLRAGVPLAIDSNKTKNYLLAEIGHLGWGGFFHTVVGTGDVPHGKPAPDGVNLIRRLMALDDATSVWFVGDNDLDLRTAEAASCYPVLLHQDITEISNNHALFRDCGELLELFTGLLEESVRRR